MSKDRAGSMTTDEVLAVIGATDRGCPVVHIVAQTHSIPGQAVRAVLELIADGEVEAFWRDPAHRSGLMFRVVD